MGGSSNSARTHFGIKHNPGSRFYQPGGLPSFFSGDVRIVDMAIDYDISTGPNINYSIRVDQTPISGAGGSLKHTLPSFAIAATPDQPQWLLAGAPGDYMYRVREIIDSQGTITGGILDGAWYRVNTTLFFTLVKGTEGDFVEWIAEIGPFPADGSIIARARWKMTFI